MMADLKTINATIFYAYQICPREAWFYFHHIDPSQDHELLNLGRITHEFSYQRERKEIFVDNLLKIDLMKGKLIAEVKRSSRHKKAARLQLAYYLYYLKHEKGLEFEGILLFPKERKTENVKLTCELEEEVESIIKQMRPVISSVQPPPAKKIKYCKSCSFKELCWG